MIKYLLGGWWDTCSATKLTLLAEHNGTGPSATVSWTKKQVKGDSQMTQLPLYHSLHIKDTNLVFVKVWHEESGTFYLSCLKHSEKHSHHMWGWLGSIGKIPVAVEDLPQDWVVRFLCHRTFPPCMESWKVPLHHLNHALPRVWLVCNTSGSWDRLIYLFFVHIFEYLTVAQITSQKGQDVQRNLHTFLTKTFFLGWRWAGLPVRHNEGARMKICTWGKTKMKLK